MTLPIVHHAPDIDRVRANTEPAINERIDRASQYRLQVQSGESAAAITQHIAKLDREWDVERLIELESSTMGLTGLVLSVLISPKFLFLPGVVSTMVLLHAVQGWYPLLPIFRRLGLRSQNEIDRERFGMKALRGDLATIPSGEAVERARAAWQAVSL